MDKEKKAKALLESLSQPKSVQTDSGRVENHSISDLIKALEYLQKKAAVDAGGDGPKSVLKRMGFYRVRNRN
jgi:hypothetical protein